jgi:hypothetical protein
MRSLPSEGNLLRAALERTRRSRGPAGERQNKRSSQVVFWDTKSQNDCLGCSDGLLMQLHKSHRCRAASRMSRPPSPRKQPPVAEPSFLSFGGFIGT